MLASGALSLLPASAAPDDDERPSKGRRSEQRAEVRGNRDRGESSSKRERGSRSETESDPPAASSPTEEEPSSTPEDLAGEITALINDGQVREGIALLEKFDEISPPSSLSPVAGVPDLEVLRLKRRLLERASGASGRSIFPGEESGDRMGKGKHAAAIGRLDAIDTATRQQLVTLRSSRKQTLFGCRNLIESGEFEGALASLDALTNGLEAIPDPHVWSSARLLRAKCLAALGRIDEARGHVSQVCEYFHGPDAFGLQSICQPHTTVEEFTEVIDYVLDAELLEQGNSFVDLHPAKMITRVETGELARGRFLLINPSPVDACVTLYADGIVRERSYSNGEWNLVWDPFLPLRHRGAMRPVCIPPFGQLTIVLEAPLLNDTGDQLVQISAGGHEIADWRFSTLTKDEPALISEVVDASYNVFNPFYRTPVSHELYFRGTDRHITNFRVEASYPCQIDYYDAVTGKLLARDIEGDGYFDNFDFDRAGFDNDYNLFPDLALDPGRPVIPIELEVTPIMPIPEIEREVTLSVQVYEEGMWLETAQDVVVFP
ncbi:MAG: tetratricopeptide repeat protein [Verrucomicrobiae bacterium]|nr:tetratricopeptide repeat protein [Verrucomicrobiae bacterium]